MRNLFTKTVAGSVIAGAALLVAACGGTETETDNLAVNEFGSDPLLDTANDATAIDSVSNGTLGTDPLAPPAPDAGATTTTNTDTTQPLGETSGGDTGGNTVESNTVGM